MVGIVIVSHSDKISQGIVDIGKQMAQRDVKIISAGGTRDGRIGTDATKIMEAIIESDDGSGVIVFVDLGSAVLSTEMAIDFLDEELKKRVVIADAPLVEGSITAIVEASLGKNLLEVKEAAEESKKLQKIN
jgi:dihydroxyacetone kinase phosphotransfer subunit